MSIPDSVAVGMLVGFTIVVLLVIWGEVTDRWHRDDER